MLLNWFVHLNSRSVPREYELIRASRKFNMPNLSSENKLYVYHVEKLYARSV